MSATAQHNMELDAAAALETAVQIAEEIAADAVWQGERCNWIGAMPEEAPGGRTTLSFRALGADLYGGSAGVGLFLAEVAATSGEPRLRRTALGALRHAISRAGDLPPSGRAGLYAGLPGVALALALAAEALQEPQLLTAAGALAAKVPAPGAVEEKEELDLISGSAGAIVGLLALADLLGEEGRPLGEERLLECAVAHGAALLARAQRSGEEELSWPSPSMPGTPGLTGLSHGAAGIAVALLALAAVSDDERYRAAASGAFAYERSLYDERAGNWPDLRDAGAPTQAEHGAGSASAQPAAKATFATFWCHGAPGGALARLYALELDGAPQLREQARAALTTTAAWSAAALESGAMNYSLCHGLAGNAEILAAGSALLPEAGPLAQRIAAAGIETYAQRGLPWPSGAHGGATPCLFLGLAGIGRFYLRLAQPQLQSLLLPTVGARIC